MAFQRRNRRRGFSRRFGKPFARQGTTWVTTLFNEVASTSAVVGELVLVNPGDIDPTRDLANAGTQFYSIKRVLFNGTFMAVPRVTLADLDIASILWAIYTIDQDDTDSDLNTTAVGTILRSERILQSGVVGWGAQGSANGVSGGGIYPGIPVNVDLRMPIRMQADEVLVFGFQQQSSFGTAFPIQPGVSAISRVLCRAP